MDGTQAYEGGAIVGLFASMGATTNNYLYTGQQFDPLTNLYSLRARYYSPFTGRFLSQDTFPVNYHNPIELNRYGYTANNPINGFDPSGTTLVSYSEDTEQRGTQTTTALTYIKQGNVIYPSAFAETAGYSLATRWISGFLLGTIVLPLIVSLAGPYIPAPHTADAPPSNTGSPGQSPDDLPNPSSPAGFPSTSPANDPFSPFSPPALPPAPAPAAPPASVPEPGSENQAQSSANTGAASSTDTNAVPGSNPAAVPDPDIDGDECDQAIDKDCDDDELITLYHYTFAENIPLIIGSGALWPSLEEKGDAQLGDGQYFTDLTPEESSTVTRQQHSAALFMRQWLWGAGRAGHLPKDVAWLEFRIPSNLVEWRAPLFGSRFKNRSVYLYWNKVNLPIQGLWTGNTGIVRFQPGRAGFR